MPILYAFWGNSKGQLPWESVFFVTQNWLPVVAAGIERRRRKWRPPSVKLERRTLKRRGCPLSMRCENAQTIAPHRYYLAHLSDTTRSCFVCCKVLFGWFYLQSVISRCSDRIGRCPPKAELSGMVSAVDSALKLRVGMTSGRQSYTPTL